MPWATPSGDLPRARACTSYRRARARTAPPGKLVVVLLDAAIGSLSRARAEPRAGPELIRSHALIAELQAGLEHARAPDLCHRLDAMYDFMLQQVMRAYVKNEPDLLGRVQDLLRALRATWVDPPDVGGTFLADGDLPCSSARPP
jgi:flagellar protein FliS